VHPAEIVVHEVERNRMTVVLNLLLSRVKRRIDIRMVRF
jgi:hypothetical protein